MPRLGIITGLVIEKAIIRDAAKTWQGEPPLLAASGPGGHGARDYALKFLEEGAAALMSFGLAGGLDPDLPSGTVMVPEEVRCPRQNCYRCDDGWRRGLAEKTLGEVELNGAPLISSDEIVTSVEAKRKLRFQCGAAAVDMESAAIAQVAASAGIPFIAIRAISDPAGQALPPMVSNAVGQTGKVHVWPLVKSVMKQPGQLGKLAKLARQAGLADQELKKLTGLAGPGFGLF